MLEGEPEALRGPLRHREQRRVLVLREVDEAAVAREVDGQQLRVPVEPQAADHEGIEAAREEVGQVERAGLLGRDRVEGGEAGIGGIAVGARQALDTVRLEDTV